MRREHFTIHRFAGTLAVAAVLAIGLSGQAKTLSLAGFAGRWVAHYQGRLLARFDLSVRAGRLTGTVAFPKRMSTNASGGVASVSAAVKRGRVVAYRAKGGGLEATVAMAGDTAGDTTNFLLRAVGQNAISVQLEGAPIQPWLLRRVRAKKR